MSMSFYEAVLTPQLDENWPERRPSLKNRINDKQDVFDVIAETLGAKVKVTSLGVRVMWIHGENGCWIRLDENGKFELGEPAA